MDSSVIVASNRDITVLAENIGLKDANVTAVAGIADLTGDIAAEGQVIISADKAVALTGDLAGGDDIRVIADQLELYGDSYAADGVLDFSGVRETVINGSTALSAASQLRLGAIRAEETQQTQADLSLSGESIVLDGNIMAASVTIDGGVSLNDDVSIVASYNGQPGDITIGGAAPTATGTAGYTNYIYGTHDLTLRGDNVTVNGDVDVRSLTASAATNFSYSGESLKTIAGLDVTAKETATIATSALDNATIAAYKIQIDGFGNNGVAVGQNAPVNVNGDEGEVNVTVTNGKDVKLDFDVESATATINAEGNIDLTAAGSLGLLDSEATGEVEVLANGSINFQGTFNSGSYMTLTAGGTIQVNNRASVSAAGSYLNMKAGDKIFVYGAVNSGSDLTLTADDFITLDGSAASVSAKGDLTLTAGDIRMWNESSVSADNNLWMKADSSIGIDGASSVSAARLLTMNADSIIVSTGEVKSTSSDAMLTANMILIDNGSSVSAEGDLTMKADGNLSVDNSSALSSGKDMTLTAGEGIEIGSDATVTAKYDLTMKADGNIDAEEGSVTADTLFIDGAKNATLGDATVKTLSVSNISGVADVTNNGDIAIEDSAIEGTLFVTADNITIDFADVTAGGVILLGDTTLNDANVTATSGNIELTGDITSEGALQLSADKAVFFYGDFAGGDDVRVIADQLELYGDASATGVLDFSGVRETVINVDGTAISADEQIRLGAVRGEDSQGAAVNLTVKAPEIVLNGDILAKNITVEGGVILNDDIAIIANDGDIAIGGAPATPTSQSADGYVYGTHALTLRGKNVAVNGLVELESLAAYAENGGFTYTGSNFKTLNDLTVTANGDIAFNNDKSAATWRCWPTERSPSTTARSRAATCPSRRSATSPSKPPLKPTATCTCQARPSRTAPPS